MAVNNRRTISLAATLTLVFLAGAGAGLLLSKRPVDVGREERVSFASTVGRQKAPGPPSDSPFQSPVESPKEHKTSQHLERELALLRQEVSHLRLQSSSQPVADVGPMPLSSKASANDSRNRDAASIKTSSTKSSTALSAQTARRTLAFWNSLNSIMAREEKMRRPPTKLTAANVASYLTSRRRAYHYAASAIRKLDASHVDAEVASHAQVLSHWYQQGAGGSQEAVSLVKQPSPQASARSKSWKQQERNHRDQCLEINERSAKLRRRMTQKYRLRFPPLL